MPHAKGSVNMAKGGKVKMAVGGPATAREAMRTGLGYRSVSSSPQMAGRPVQAQPTQRQAMTNVKPPMTQVGAPISPQMGNRPQVSQPMTNGGPLAPGMGNRPQVSQPMMPGPSGAADEMRPAVMKRGGMAKGGMKKK
jgi:hypothetical protein